MKKGLSQKKRLSESLPMNGIFRQVDDWCHFYLLKTILRLLKS